MKLHVNSFCSVKMFQWIFLFTAYFILQCSSEHVYSTVDIHGQIKIVNYSKLKQVKSLMNQNEDSIVGKAFFSNQINETGWSFLEIRTFHSPGRDWFEAFQAGRLEGQLTHQLINYHWLNTMSKLCKRNQVLCIDIKQYIEDNYSWIKEMILNNAESEYWHQVNLLFAQLKGIWSGYNETATPDEVPLTFTDILWMNMNGDIMDLMNCFTSRRNMTQFEEVWSSVEFSRCSALVKLLPDMSDLFVAHNSWYIYKAMTRIQKRYIFEYSRSGTHSSDVVPAPDITFSSYPGYIFSFDDFLVASSGLVVTETTITNNNKFLWENVTPVGQLPTFIRVMISTRLADSGKTWKNIFQQHNSGTYNNQWSILDYKLFKPNGHIGTKDLLWVCEQMPGYIHCDDLTNKLLTNLYWPSYNVPYFSDTNRMSNITKLVPELFSYDNCARARIFRRDHVKVHDLHSMYSLMRYNDFKNDPFSTCDCTPPYSGYLSISARDDLNSPNGTYPRPSLGYMMAGAYDAKVTSYSLSKRMEILAVSGPMYDDKLGMPPFRWSSNKTYTKPVGQPDLWAFPPLIHKWVTDRTVL